MQEDSGQLQWGAGFFRNDSFFPLPSLAALKQAVRTKQPHP